MNPYFFNQKALVVGAGAMGVYPGDNPVQTIIATWPWGAYLGAEALEHGIRVKTSSWTPWKKP